MQCFTRASRRSPLMNSERCFDRANLRRVQVVSSLDASTLWRNSRTGKTVFPNGRPLPYGVMGMLREFRPAVLGGTATFVDTWGLTLLLGQANGLHTRSSS